MLETHLLLQLAALAEYGTLSEASRKLNLSQPALSRSMRKLEDAIGRGAVSANQEPYRHE